MRGFALPSVLAASVVMLSVLVVAATFVTSIRTSIKSQHYSRLMYSAKEAGIAYAQACIASDPTVANLWGQNPLKPNTDCNGEKIDSAGESVFFDDVNNLETSFTVGSAAIEEGKVTDISATGTLSLLRNSTNKQWKSYSLKGGYAYKQLTLPVTWKQISSGVNTTCAISQDDKAYCWGDNSSGQLGDGSTIESHIPVAVSTTGLLKDKKILSISTGITHSCAIADDNNAYCWGDSTQGRLGNDGAVDSYQRSPVAVTMPDVGFKSISVGHAHTCAVSTDNRAFCWGNNIYGQLGNDSTSVSNVPVIVSGGDVLTGEIISSIRAGQSHTCATTTDNKLFCWGYNSYGQVGDGTTDNYSIPVNVTNKGVLSGKTIKSVAIGPNSSHTCVIATDISLGDQAYCWGDNGGGQLGNNISGSGKKSVLPVAVYNTGLLANKTVLSISVGASHSCVIASDNKVYCWGSNLSGALGIGNVSNIKATPQAVSIGGAPESTSIKLLSAGGNHSCVVASDNKIYCWGAGDNSSDINANNYGVLGNGTAIGSAHPDSVIMTSDALGKTVKSISADGYNHSCAVMNDDKAYCWGLNNKGQLGDGSVISSRKPIPVFTGTVETKTSTLYGKKVLSIKVGTVDQHTCAIAQNDNAVGEVFCWGDNASGQLGVEGIISSSKVPAKVYMGGVMSGKNIKLISSGDDFSCAVSTDNEVFCWGKNDSGQLGDGISSLVEPKSLTPVKVVTDVAMGGKSITSITSGTVSTCVLYGEDNKAYCWGYNYYGALGDTTKTNISYNTPILVTIFGSKTIKSISAASFLTCAIIDDGASGDQAYCWGQNTSGSLGNGTSAGSTVPVKVTADILNGKTIKSISTTQNGACLIASDDLAYCWGSNSSGQLGIGIVTINEARPVRVLSSEGYLKGKKIAQLSVGASGSCVITKYDNLSYCWGSNSKGQLGNNTTINSSVPTPLFDSLTYLQEYKYTY